MLRSGASIYHVQRVLGHTDIAALRPYLDLVEVDVHEAHRDHGAVDTYMFLRFDRQAHEHSPAGVAIHDRELTHDERIYELERRYNAYDRIIDHLTGEPGHDQLVDKAQR
jgi:hypothetical protein